MKKRHLYILSTIILTMLITCKKDENDKIKFNWTKNGNTLFYDLYVGSEIKKDHLEISIYDNQFFQNGVAASFPLDILQSEFKVKKGGLYGLSCYECGMGILTCFSKFEFLYAPNSPSLNQEIPQYSCSKNASYNIKIVEIDRTITTPLGSFNTYVMLHKNGDKSYWNADEGLIMYELVDYRDKKTVIEIYKLNRMQ